MKTNTSVTIMNIVLMALIGFLCWHFNAWWPVVLILFVFSTEVHHKEDKEKSTNDDSKSL